MPQLIRQYFPHLSNETLHKIELAAAAYKEWNEKINVISRKDIDHILLHHFLHSMSIMACRSFDEPVKFIDVGTGGGFPGVPLAICLPHCEFLLVDSIGKKLTVVQEVCKAAGITNVTTLHSRAEQVKARAHFVTGRAVETLKEFHRHVHHLVNSNPAVTDKGILYLKGGDLDQEIAELKKPVQICDLSEKIQEPYFETKKLVYIPF